MRLPHRKPASSSQQRFWFSRRDETLVDNARNTPTSRPQLVGLTIMRITFIARCRALFRRPMPQK
jgi:hypothetical protein